MKFLILISLLLGGCTRDRVTEALKSETPYCNQDQTHCVKLINIEGSKVKALEIKIHKDSMTLSTYNKWGAPITMEPQFEYLVTGTITTEPKTIYVEIVNKMGVSYSQCSNFCKHQNSKPLRDSDGVCLCDNESGRKADAGYLNFLATTPDFKVGYCISYIIKSEGSVDENDELIKPSKPIVEVSNLTYMVDSIDSEKNEYYLSEVESRLTRFKFRVQRQSSIDYIDANYVRTECRKDMRK